MNDIDLLLNLHADFDKCMSVYHRFSQDRETLSIRISNICSLVALNKIDRNDEQYKNADDSYPVLVTTQVTNARSRKFTLIDGRNRLLKLKDKGEERIDAYLVSMDELKEFIG